MFYPDPERAPYTVYTSPARANDKPALFPDAVAAHDWAKAEFAKTGGPFRFECRDRDFNHVFTVEA